MRGWKRGWGQIHVHERGNENPRDKATVLLNPGPAIPFSLWVKINKRKKSGSSILDPRPPYFPKKNVELGKRNVQRMYANVF